MAVRTLAAAGAVALLLLTALGAAAQDDNWALVFGMLENIQARLALLENAVGRLAQAYGPSGLRASALVTENGRLVLRPLENGMLVPPGSMMVLVVRDENGDPVSGTVEVYPPVENLSAFLAGGLKYEAPLVGGMCLLPVQEAEGVWTGRVLVQGRAPLVFSFRVGRPQPQQPQQPETVYITTEGAFSVGKPCLVKAVSGSGEVVRGTIRVVVPEDPSLSAEGPNPLPYVPKTREAYAYFLQDGEVRAGPTLLQEYSQPKREERGVGWRVAVPAAALSALLVFFFVRRRRRLVIPR